MGATTNYALPYPDNGDGVDVPYDVKQLADAVDVQLAATGTDTGWVNCTLKSGFAWSSGLPMQVRKIGQHVYARWGIAGTGLTANGAFIVANIPAGFRPAMSSYVPLGTNSAATYCSGYIAPSGDIEVRTGATVPGYVMVSGLSWPVG